MLSLAQFAPLVGQRFELHDGAASYPAALLEARKLNGPPLLGREPFALLFEGPAAPLLPQHTYRVSHPQLRPAAEMFLVPIGRQADGVRYEAIFT